jgi:hypothetical protein
MDCINLVQVSDKWRALVKEVMNVGVSYNAWNFLISPENISFCRRTLLTGVS